MGVCIVLCFSRWSKEVIILSFGAQWCLFFRRSSTILQREKWLRKLKQFNQSCTNRWQHAEKSTDERHHVFPSSRRWEKKRAGEKQEKKTLSRRQWKPPEITAKRLHETLWRITFKIITVAMKSCVCFSSFITVGWIVTSCSLRIKTPCGLLMLRRRQHDQLFVAAAGCWSSLHRLRHGLSQLTAGHWYMLAQHFSLKSHLRFVKVC